MERVSVTIRSLLCLCLLAALCDIARADDMPGRDAAWIDQLRRSREALEWTDELVRHDWRLQHRPQRFRQATHAGSSTPMTESSTRAPAVNARRYSPISSSQAA